MKILRHILVFGAAAVLTLAVMELYLQLAEIQTPMETRIDARIGPTYIPSRNVTRFKEGFAIGSTNAYGYLGEALGREKSGDEYRILMLGDSFVMGNLVFERDHFKHEMERILRPDNGWDVNVLNFGKADFALPNMYAYYLNFAREFSGDLMLYFVDIQDLTPSRQFEQDLYPQLRFDGERISVDYAFNTTPKYKLYKRVEWISTRSALFRLTHKVRHVYYQGAAMKIILDKLHPLFYPNYKPRKYTRPDTLELSDLTLAILRELANDGRSIVVYRDEVPVELREQVAASGVPTIDLAPLLRDLEDQGRRPCYWPVTGKTGHWNHDTQLEVGRFLGRELAPRVRSEIEAAAAP